MPLFPVEVKLDQSLPSQQLEEILVAAATDVGWKATVKDKYVKSYKIGSVQAERNYQSTDINLRGTFLPAATVLLFKKEKRPLDYFSIGYAGFWGVALSYEVEKYLGAVSERIKAASVPKTSLRVLAGTV